MIHLGLRGLSSDEREVAKNPDAECIRTINDMDLFPETPVTRDEARQFLYNRFIVVPYTIARNLQKPRGYLAGTSDRNYLLDTRTGQIVWDDHMEPEDATLLRDLLPLVELLNRLGHP